MSYIICLFGLHKKNCNYALDFRKNNSLTFWRKQLAKQPLTWRPFVNESRIVETEKSKTDAEKSS